MKKYMLGAALLLQNFTLSDCVDQKIRYYAKNSDGVYNREEEPPQYPDMLQAITIPGQTFIAPLRWALRTKTIAKFNRMLMDTFIGKNRIVPFIKKYAINMDEFKLSSAEDYETFNQFFIRELKPGIRTIDIDKKAFISPADSKLLVIENINETDLFVVKNTGFTLKQFLGDSIDSSLYKDGMVLIFRLTPFDYHRYHFPIDCVPVKATAIEGILEDVDPVTYYAGYNSLCLNERHNMLLITKKNKLPIVAVAVGALLVGTINETYAPGKEYRKGDEMGYFELGGSTLVLVLPKGMLTLKPAFIEHSKEGLETQVKMGEVIGYLE